jgi:hypothetical protein
MKSSKIIKASIKPAETVVPPGIKIFLVNLFRNYWVRLLLEAGFVCICVQLGTQYGKIYYFSVGRAIFTNAICNSAVTTWGLIIAVYLHKEIIEEGHEDLLTKRFGDFFGNLIRPKVSVVLLVTIVLFMMVFLAIKMTDLRIEELSKLTNQ